MSDLVIKNTWDFLKQYTDARIALGRTGHSIPTKQLLDFQLSHAKARDAVYSELDIPNITAQTLSLGLETLIVRSMAKDRAEYLKRPDLGRKLSEASGQILQQVRSGHQQLSIVLVDGLSAQAININAVPFLRLFIPLAKDVGFNFCPISIVSQGRVAIGDHIGAMLNAGIVIVLIGERPGLSSPDSMGIYMTYDPQPGLTDECRNCISNIRPRGLNYEDAALKLFYLVNKSKELKLSGINLKDDMLKIT